MTIVQASPAASVSSGEIEKAKQQRLALQAELDSLVASYEGTESKLARTRDLLVASQSSLADSEARLQAAQQRISVRANLTYREGSASVFGFLFTATSFGDFNRRLKLVGQVSRDDSAHMAAITRARTKTEAIRNELDRRAAAERTLLHQLSAKTDALNSKFYQAGRLEKTLVSQRQREIELEKQRKAKEAAAAAAAAKAKKPPVSKQPAVVFKPAQLPSPAAIKTITGGLHCPVDGPNSFSDTYGEPREGGRRHEGVDIFAAQGTPTVAVTDAVVHRLGASGAGGISVEIRGTNGTHYYYAHLARTAGVSVGQKVAAGARVGYVGATGNASMTAPHLHFEEHPGGGGPVNPYRTAKAACG